MKPTTKKPNKQVNRSKKPTHLSLVGAPTPYSKDDLVKVCAQQAQTLFLDADQLEAQLLNVTVHIDQLAPSRDVNDRAFRVWLVALRRALTDEIDAKLSLANVMAGCPANV